MLFAANNSTNDNVAERMEERTKERINNTYKQYSEQMGAARPNIEKLLSITPIVSYIERPVYFATDSAHGSEFN